MLVEWLYRTTLEVSLLIGLVLVLRPIVRRTLGARAAYWLWFIPVLRAILIDRPEWPRTLVENVGVPGGELSIAIYPSPDVWVLPAGVPWGALWLGGALFWVALRIAGAIRFRRALAVESSAIDLPSQLSALIPEHLLRREPRFFATDLPGTPFVTGLVRPLVYLPTDFFQRFSVEEQRWVVQHELVHAARADLWVQAIWELLRGVFWFNPIVHLAAGAMRDDQELACDQAVLRGSSHEERYSYGRALLASAGAHLFPSLLNFFGNPKRRIAMIRNHQASRRRDIAGIALCALVGVFALTKAPVSVAEIVSGEPITLFFQQIPITKVVELIRDFSKGGEIVGLEQLGDVAVTVRIQGVPAREALQGVLNCAGFAYEERGEVLAIVPLRAPGSAACSSNMQLAGSVTAAPVIGQPADISSYDANSTTEIRGTVVKFIAALGADASITVAVPDSNGATQQWTVALGKAADMRKVGMTPLTFAPGTQVVTSGNPAANSGEHRILAQNVATADGFAWTR